MVKIRLSQWTSRRYRREESAEKQIWGRKDRGMSAEPEVILRVIFKDFVLKNSSF
jgi:hypothetical protein